MSGLFGRIIGWFVQDILVKQLANSRTFQRLALKIDTTLNKVINIIIPNINTYISLLSIIILI